MGSKECQAKVEVDGGADASDGATEQEGEDGEEQEDQGDNQSNPGDDIQSLVLPGRKMVLKGSTMQVSRKVGHNR